MRPGFIVDVWAEISCYSAVSKTCQAGRPFLTLSVKENVHRILQFIWLQDAARRSKVKLVL